VLLTWGRLAYQHDIEFVFVVKDSDDVATINTLVMVHGLPPNRVWVSPEGATTATVVTRLHEVADAALEAGFNVAPRIVNPFGGSEAARRVRAELDAVGVEPGRAASPDRDRWRSRAGTDRGALPAHLRRRPAVSARCRSRSPCTGVDGVVRVRFGSLSQTTAVALLLDELVLHRRAGRQGRRPAPHRVGAELSATADAGLQLPSAAVLPVTNTFWPQVVVAFTSNVTGAGHDVRRRRPSVRAPACSASAPFAGTVAVTGRRVDGVRRPGARAVPRRRRS
jgi:hypothetical protein